MNAMNKVVLTMFKTFFLWIFFMLWPGKGHEDFNLVKMFGMVLLIIGTFIYIKLDLEDIEKD